MKNLPLRSDSSVTDASPDSLPPPLLPFVGDATLATIGRDQRSDAEAASTEHAFLYVANVLQDATDYRGLLRQWFSMVRLGGKLAITVPHAFLCEREVALPSRTQPSRRRLYTPASLLSEVEEALEPNSYRVRLLSDHDVGYDYGDDTPTGEHSILLVLERIEPPAWSLDAGNVEAAPGPAFEFEPARTRREVLALAPRARIVILKFDHLGDFIMSIPALEKARQAFPDAHITLVVGHWNEGMARDLGLFDSILAFDAFPRNSSEQEVDLAGRVHDFRQLLSDDYDLAIDLRVDSDTRFFLRHVRADVCAGIGTRSQFSFLDIFLPVDGSRHGFEAAADTLIGHAAYAATPICAHGNYRIAYDPNEKAVTNPHDPCLVYGPYLRLPAGDYLYEPQIEIGSDDQAMLVLDIAIDMERVVHSLARTSAIPRLRFTIEDPKSAVEFRIFRVVDAEIPPFSFYGGRLLRRGANSVLHQSEYLSLLIDLVRMRTDRYGLLREIRAKP